METDLEYLRSILDFPYLIVKQVVYRKIQLVTENNFSVEKNLIRNFYGIKRNNVIIFKLRFTVEIFFFSKEKMKMGYDYLCYDPMSKIIKNFFILQPEFNYGPEGVKYFGMIIFSDLENVLKILNKERRDFSSESELYAFCKIDIKVFPEFLIEKIKNIDRKYFNSRKLGVLASKNNIDPIMIKKFKKEFGDNFNPENFLDWCKNK